MRMVVFRSQPLETTTIDVQLVKKPGKGLGICLKSRKGSPGVYVSDIVSNWVENYPESWFPEIRPDQSNVDFALIIIS